jgi:hypothetical protein
MREPEADRSDPEVRAALSLRRFERGQRGRRVVAAFALFALAAGGPFAAAPVAGAPGATVGAVVASALLAGIGVAIWPWTWSAQEREHHRLAAVWAQARAAAGERTPWDRYAAWAEADGEHVRLLLIRQAGTAGDADAAGAPSPFSASRVKRLDGEAIADATIAMEDLRAEAASLEARARQRHAEAVAAAARKPYDDALRAVDRSAAAEQRRAEAEMLEDVARQEAARRRAQAAAVARALRRP